MWGGFRVELWDGGEKDELCRGRGGPNTRWHVTCGTLFFYFNFVREVIFLVYYLPKGKLKNVFFQTDHTLGIKELEKKYILRRISHFLAYSALANLWLDGADWCMKISLGKIV